ncbi:MAG: MBL fold metallo-hydrolase [bacterium]
MNRAIRTSIYGTILVVILLLLFLIGRLTQQVVKIKKTPAPPPNTTVTTAPDVPVPGNETTPAAPAPVTTGKMVMSVIDVGQGDSILVQFPNGQTMLVDAGTSDHGGTVVNYLRARGVGNIDVLAGTHPHEDHIGGMSSVLNAVKVAKVWDSGFNHGSPIQRNYLMLIKDKNIPFEKVGAGYTAQFGTARTEVLAPVRFVDNVNDNSLVLRLTYGNISYLLTGDMENAERASVGHWAASTVLKVAHHGSRNGTDDTFARAIHPKYAIISCAAVNDYGHPHIEAISALEKAGAEIHRTSIEGTVVVETDGNTVNISSPNSSSIASAPVVVPSAEIGAAYIGNKNSKTFHRPTCASLPASQNRVTFGTRDEAIQEGYHPCTRCRP